MILRMICCDNIYTGGSACEKLFGTGEAYLAHTAVFNIVGNGSACSDSALDGQFFRDMASGISRSASRLQSTAGRSARAAGQLVHKELLRTHSAQGVLAVVRSLSVDLLFAYRNVS